MKDDGHLVASIQGVHFDKEIKRIYDQIKTLPFNDSNEELGIIHQFVTEKIMVRVRQMALYVGEKNEIGNNVQQSLQIM